MRGEEGDVQYKSGKWNTKSGWVQAEAEVGGLRERSVSRTEDLSKQSIIKKMGKLDIQM